MTSKEINTNSRIILRITNIKLYVVLGALKMLGFRKYHMAVAALKTSPDVRADNVLASVCLDHLRYVLDPYFEEQP